MEIVKRVIKNKHYSETIFCSKLEIVDDNSYLLGFKDFLPVLTNINTFKYPTMSSVRIPRKDINKRAVKVETNNQTGEKFIFLNGKKIKILAESEFPKNVQLMKFSSLQNASNTNSLVKIKILKGISRKTEEHHKKPEENLQPPNNLGNLISPNVDKSITSLISNKVSPINENKLVKIIPLTIAENTKVNTTDKSCFQTDGIKMFKTDNLSGKSVFINSTVLNNLRNVSSDIHNVQSAALDLTKHCESQNGNTPGVIKQDKGLQTTIKPATFDKEVQTDEYDADLESLLKLNLTDLLEMPMTLPTKKIMNVSEDMIDESSDDGPKSYTNLNVSSENFMDNTVNEQPDKAKNFFNELRGALTVDDKGNMPIHAGVIKNDSNMVKRNVFLLKVLKQSVDIRNNNDYSPLQLAIIHDASIEIVATLLAKEARIGVTDSEGNNIIHYAVEFDRKDTLRLVLSYASLQGFALDQHNHEGLTPLMVSCLNSSHDCAEILLDADADPNCRDQISGRTALFHAAEKHDVDMVEMLLQFNACTKIKNFFGTSPHDAMYEIEDIPDVIKFMILGKNNKRKIADDPRPAKFPKKGELSRVGLKTYARLEKIRNPQVLKTLTSPVK